MHVCMRSCIGGGPDRGDSAGNAGLARREVEVVVRYSGTLATLSDLGLKVTAASGNDALGFIRLSDLEAFAAQPQIERVRLAGTPRPALDRSVPAINVPIVWQAPPGYTRPWGDCRNLRQWN